MRAPADRRLVPLGKYALHRNAGNHQSHKGDHCPGVRPAARDVENVAFASGKTAGGVARIRFDFCVIFFYYFFIRVILTKRNIWIAFNKTCIATPQPRYDTPRVTSCIFFADVFFFHQKDSTSKVDFFPRRKYWTGHLELAISVSVTSFIWLTWKNRSRASFHRVVSSVCTFAWNGKSSRCIFLHPQYRERWRNIRCPAMSQSRGKKGASRRRMVNKKKNRGHILTGDR